jgi:hypothetical protein
VVCRHIEADLIHEGHDGGHTHLTRLVVAHALEPVEGVGEHQLVPGAKGDVEGVWVLEGPWVAFLDQLVHVDAQIPEQPVADVGVRRLVLDDRDDGAEVVERMCVLRGTQVGAGRVAR